MNEENEWDHRISAGVKEGPTDCIMIEVPAALKKMKSHKAPGLSRLIAEMIQATGDSGYCNSVDIGFMLWYCERRLHPKGLEVKCGITNLEREKGIQWSVDLTEEINCWKML